MMEILVRCCAKVFWVNSGHMVCDSLTKLSVKDPGLDLLYYVLEQAEVRITYCDHSWKKEMSMKKATEIKPLDLMNPNEWNDNEGESFDVSGTTMRSRENKNFLETLQLAGSRESGGTLNDAALCLYRCAVRLHTLLHTAGV